jgi:hypothetical protein
MDKHTVSDEAVEAALAVWNARRRDNWRRALAGEGGTPDPAAAMRAALEAAAPLSQAQPAPLVETGWLIEMRSGTPQWFYPGEDGEDGQRWTTDSLEALRFARKVDAEAYIEDLGWTGVVASEHQWALDRALSASTPEEKP